MPYSLIHSISRDPTEPVCEFVAEKFASGVQNCPHCLAHVIISSDGICPRCQGDARSTSLVDPNKTSVWLFARDRIPSHCLRCGNLTDRKIRIAHTESWLSSAGDSDSSGRSGLGIVILRLMGFGVLKLLFGMMFRILFGVKQQDERQFERIAITVPECPECNRGPLFPIAASMSDSALKVAAHRTFVDALRCLNEQ